VDITTTSEDLVEKIYTELYNATLKNLQAQELTEEEVNANMVLTKKNIERDSNAIVDIVVRALSE
jgi:hypothetical protein